MGKVGLRSTVGWTRKTRTSEDRSASIPPSHRFAHDHAKSLPQGFLTAVEEFIAPLFQCSSFIPRTIESIWETPQRGLFSSLSIAERALMNVSR